MKGAIINATQKEVLAMPEMSTASFELMTNFKESKWPSYTMPLVLMVITPGADCMQMPGGLTMMNYIIELHVYNHMPNPSGYDPTEYSADTQDIVESVRLQFSNFTKWRSDEMVAVSMTPYPGLRWTYDGSHDAKALDHEDGLVMGEMLRFETIAWDQRGLGITPGPVLDTIEQVDVPPANGG